MQMWNDDGGGGAEIDDGGVDMNTFENMKVVADKDEKQGLVK